jgi:WhiB family transcriptional regulator, redox-sensing transcriptional regulator
MGKRYVDDYVRGEEWRAAAECVVGLPRRISDEQLETGSSVLRAQQIMNLMYGADKETQKQAAEKFCGSCAVKDACLQYALEHHEKDGVWGGTTEWERAALFPSQRADKAS